MSVAASDSARWDDARRIAAEFAETGIDPLDLQAAQAARQTLVRRFVLDLVLIVALVGIVGSVALMLMRAIAGEDPLDGREIWIASAALALLLVVVVLRSVLPKSAPAYERAWSAYVERVWPGSRKGDELGAARLAFVRQAAASQASASRASGAATGSFPSAAPGRRAG